uniref:Uncharacterized protein n=1 Tax=Arundo donax TaxID=35708 RepID=A0A0A9HBP2_ARUDO
MSEESSNLTSTMHNFFQ